MFPLVLIEGSTGPFISEIAAKRPLRSRGTELFCPVDNLCCKLQRLRRTAPAECCCDPLGPADLSKYANVGVMYSSPHARRMFMLSIPAHHGQFWPAAETVYEHFMFTHVSDGEPRRISYARVFSKSHHQDRFFEEGTGRYSIMGQSRKTVYLMPKRPSRLRRHGDLWGRVRPRAVEDDTRPLVEG